MEIEQNVSLADFSTLKVGGPADFFVRAENLDGLKKALEFAGFKNLPVLVLGGGSNILFPDAGFRGLVLKNEITGIEFEENLVKVGAGEALASLISQSAEKNLAGLENLAGVPGTVGGAVVGNSNEIGARIISVTIFENGAAKVLEKSELEFSYRDSNLRDKILIEIEFELQESSENLKEKIADLIRQKTEKQPYIGTAGSWFRNPSSSEFLRASPDGRSAWELIDQAGCRGLQIGGARVSEKHTNFFENTGSATAADFLELEKTVSEKVKEKFEIELEREVIVVR